jgi:hypothetical protein
MSLEPPEAVGKLQRVLRAKAKECPDYRFYALYASNQRCQDPFNKGPDTLNNPLNNLHS